MNSAASSALVSRQASRATTPIPIEAQHQLNPYRLPRFWRGYVLGGLTLAGAYGLHKLGSFIKDYFYNKFHRPYVPALAPSIPALPTPTPKYETLVHHNNRHK